MKTLFIYTVFLIYISVTNVASDQVTPSKVDVSVYYESHCPGSREFLSDDLMDAIEKLSDYLVIKTYPYGLARTTIEENGEIKFRCQHGPEECYGNKLHACALDIIGNTTRALLFNACLMNDLQEAEGSDDNAADECGNSMSINSTAIKDCAKDKKGSELLKYYGEESRKINYRYVPYIFINGKLYKRTRHFFEDLCGFFSNPPSICHKV